MLHFYLIKWRGDYLNILAIGDVVAKVGCNFLRDKLSKLKEIKEIDLVIANGENSADGNGITPYSAKQLFSAGVDVITTGNHAFRRKEVYEELNRNPYIIRPINYPKRTTPGKGSCIINVKGINVRIINLIGNVYIDSFACPFLAMDEILEKDKEPIITIVDFHAEATAEKRAMGFYLDGRISAIFGTHTHIQTADQTILEKGTGYITDLGMTGTIDSVLGVKKELSIRKMKEKMPVRFETSIGECKMDCVVFNIDEQTGKTKAISRLQIK